MPMAWCGPQCSSTQRACRTMRLKRSTSTMHCPTTSTPCLVRKSPSYTSQDGTGSDVMPTATKAHALGFEHMCSIPTMPLQCRPRGAAPGVGHRAAVHTRATGCVLHVALRKAHQRGAADRGGSVQLWPVSATCHRPLLTTVQWLHIMLHTIRWPKSRRLQLRCRCVPAGH